jgi:hypothetical protein
LDAGVSDFHGKYSQPLIDLVLSCMQADPQARPHSVLSVQKVLAQPPQTRASGSGSSAYQATQFFPDARRSVEKFLR